METIFALASGGGRAGVAVIRISGIGALEAARQLAGTLPEARRAAVRRLRDPRSGETLDSGLVVTFPGPGSFTGEDCVELHVHGSVAVVRSVSAALDRLPGVRQAEPGEFTRRAFENGRLDLAQIEGLGDLVVAETAAQQRQAIAAMQGRVGQLAGEWRAVLLRALALVEASIDFADEDLPADVLAPVIGAVDGVLASMRQEIAGSQVAERLRDGFVVALVGPPNSGKSTLLNRLAGRDAALTSEVAGTTRDVIEVRLDLGGLPVTVLDMAGLRETENVVEGLGIARARVRAEAADVRVFLVSELWRSSGLGRVSSRRRSRGHGQGRPSARRGRGIGSDGDRR